MLESQLAQLAAAVPPLEKDKIPGQPKELESANLVDIFRTSHCYKEDTSPGWKDESLPVKKGDPGSPVIPIQIGPHEFEAALYDYGSNINIMAKVIYEKIHGNPLLCL